MADHLRKALEEIRDSTFRNSVTLRSIAQRALEADALSQPVAEEAVDTGPNSAEARRQFERYQNSPECVALRQAAALEKIADSLASSGLRGTGEGV